MTEPLRGPRARKVIEEFEKNPPSPELMARAASDLRLVGHFLIRTARRLEDGQHEAVSDMLSEPKVLQWATKILHTEVLARALTERIIRADAEEN